MGNCNATIDGLLFFYKFSHLHNFGPFIRLLCNSPIPPSWSDADLVAMHSPQVTASPGSGFFEAKVNPSGCLGRWVGG
jgi:hypothetical protein